ncbi:MAG: hypothetical protein ACNA8L_12310 [Luteolibacter sp.]|jgi:hypothetical protein
MVHARRRLLMILAATLFGVPCDGARAQAPVQPPYNMRWGDSPEKMIQWAARHTMDVHITMPGDQPDLRIIRISPANGFIPETDVRAVEGRFLHGRMFELAAHYDDPEAPFEVLMTRFEDLRRKLAAEHGAMLANRVLREVDEGFVIRTRSFHREPVKGLFLLLTLTTIEDPARASRARFSLVYRNENLKAELQER